MTKLIEAIHSTYGIVKCSMEKSDYGTIHFHRPDGSFMGEMDRDGGGMLGHPHKEVDHFIDKSFDKNLLEMDYKGYVELENILKKKANKAFPGYFIGDIDVPL